MRVNELKGRPVVSITDANKIGNIDDVLFDDQLHDVVGFTFKQGMFSHTDALLRDQVSKIGQDAITISGQDVINDVRRIPQLANAMTSHQAAGTKILTESGTLVGTITDLELDDEARTVVRYILDAPLLDRLRHQQQTIPATDVLKRGEGGIMVIKDTATPPES
jgi:uncharacterized protein YrrD